MYIHLLNVPDSADETIIRRYFKDLKISDGGVEIVGSINGDVFLTFDDETDILKALTFGEKPIHGCRIKVLLAQPADKEKIIEKALKPSKSSSKRSKSSKGSNLPEFSTPYAATPETAALGKQPDAGYAAPAFVSYPAPQTYPAARTEWSAELEAKLHSATTQRPQLASDIVRNAERSKGSNLPEFSTRYAATPETAALREWSAELEAKLHSATTQRPQLASDIVRNAERSKGSNLPEFSTPYAATPETAALGNRPDAGYAVSELASSPAARTEWTAELKTKLHGATTQRPQLASDIVRNALLKMNEGQSRTPIDAPYTPPSQVAPPPKPIPDVTSDMLKNILKSTNVVPPPPPVGAPYNQRIPAPHSAGLTIPQMPPRQQWGTQVTHPRGFTPIPPPNMRWPVLPNTRFPPPGLTHTSFRQRGPAPPPRPPMSTGSRVVPPPRPVAVPVVTKTPLTVPPNAAQALGSTEKRSRWGGMAVGSSIPTPAKVLGNVPLNIKQKPSATQQVISQNVTVKPDLKRERTPAKSTSSKAEAIVILDSDSDSGSEEKKKKRKIGNDSTMKNEKSDGGRDKSQRVYRSKQSRSRSRSRTRSRSRSRSRRRDRSKSRGRDQSRSRGRRSRSKSRNRSRSRSQRRRSRDRSRSRERDRGREQRQKPRQSDQNKPRKPSLGDAGPIVRSLPTKKPVSLEMFRNDPNSVIVHNIAETVTIMVFRDFFYGHPIVKDGIVLTPSEDIPNSQTGYIKFVHKKDVEETKQLSFTTLDGRKLLIKSCCEERIGPVTQTAEVASKVGYESEGYKSGIPNKPATGNRETISEPLKVLKIPAPKESPFGLLGVSEHITSYHVGIRGFKPGTTATEMWSWFGGPDGHVKGIIVSHRIRKDDDELAFVMYGSKALRNTFRGPKHVPTLVWHRYSEKAVIHKLISNDVCYLTETTLRGQDREVSKAEIRHLRNFRPEGPTKPPLQEQEEDVPQTESSKSGQPTQHCSLASWMKLSYICLHETPKGISASKVWSWYGGANGHAEGVILANCKSKNELKGDRFNVAFVGFRDPYVVQQYIDKRSSGQRYSSDGTMRFLARLPDSGMIFQSTTSGQDRVLPKHERLQLREKYLTQEEMFESKSKSEGPPSSKEFELSEEFSGVNFLQICEPDKKELTASEAWSLYPPETCTTRGAVLVKFSDGSPALAYIAFIDNLTRNKAHAEFDSTTGKAMKASWAYGVRRFILAFAEKGQIFISTKSGVDRPITEKEKAYCRRTLKNSTAWNTNMISRDFITDPVEYAKELEKDAAVAAAATADKSDELFYLHLKRIPPRVTACEVWNWFHGSTGNSKSAVVIYGTNGIAACAYVGFEREIDRDNERPKQKFSKVCTYRNRGVRIMGLAPGCKVTESTTTGIDRGLNEHDLSIMRWKMRRIDGLDKKAKTADEGGESTVSNQVEENYKEQHPNSQEKDIFKKPSSAPPGKPRETNQPYGQSPWVQLQTKQQSQPKHASSQEKDVKTITPYEQSPWVQVERKPQPQPQPQPSSLEPWQRMSYLCLYETPKGNTASQVWSWFGAEKGQAQCVILAHCSSQNQLQDGSFHVAFVGFKEPCILKKELDRLGPSKWFSPDETMRFLARLPYDCPIFRALTFGHDRLLSKQIRMRLEENYLTAKECVEKQRSELKPEEILTSIPNPGEFTLSEENVHGMLFVQHRVLPKICTACKVWSWHQLDSGRSKGVILLKEADGTPHSAFVAYEDAKARAEALAKQQFTSKASWTCVVRRVSVLADRGFQVFMSTTLGKDRVPTEAERAYMLHIRSTNTTPVSSDPMSTDTEPTKVLSTAAAIAIAASSEHTKTPKKEIDLAAAAAADKSDQFFYLRIRKLPEKATACQVWSWFQGSSGNSKSAVVVYGANNVTVCAYVGFEKEMHRDMGVTNQRFSKACTYHSRSVFLLDLKPSFKVTESTMTGVDRELAADDFAVIRYKLQQNAVEKKKEQDSNTNPGPSCQQQPNQNTPSTSMQVSSYNGQSNLIERPPAQQSVSIQGHRPQIDIYKPVHQPKMEIDEPVHQPPMEIDKPVHQPKMEIDKPVHQTKMEIDKPVHQSKMEVDKPVHQPKMNVQQLLESVKNLHEAENTIYFRLIKLRPNITAGEVWSWFRGSRGPTRCATLVRDFDGTALFAYVGFVSDHTPYLENLELGTFSLCSPKARNIELASLHPSAQVIQSTKHGDKAVLPETLYLFRAGIMGGAKAGTGT